MDRPILLTNLFNVATPELGVKVLEAPDPATLTTRANAVIAAAAAGGSASPYLQGFHLAGGGAGESCRAILTLGKNVGWGLFTSIPANLARVIFRRAHHHQQLTEVLEQMYAAIAAAGGDDAFVWEPQIVGTGRDGSYLVGLAWCDGTVGSLCLNAESFAETGPYTTPTTILSLTIPQSPDATLDSVTSWRVSWGMLVNDTTSSGAGCRLNMDGAPLWESYEAGAAAEWQANGAQYNHVQSATGPTVFDLIAVNTGVNAISVRGCYLRAEIANYPNNPS
jgi:hypothetical protein